MSAKTLRPFEVLAEKWIAEAKRRHQVTAVDAVADTLKYVAGELLEHVRLASFNTDELTVDQFAEKHGVLDATVRRWCRTERIGARLTPLGYRIPTDAVPPVRRQRVA